MTAQGESGGVVPVVRAVAPHTPIGVDDLERASQVCDAAARQAGVTVRSLTDLADLAAVVELFADVWGRSANPPVSLEMLRALTKAGNYVGGAIDQGRLVGACVGFFHAPSEDALHSHIAGVAPGSTGRNIGFALKLHQRAWALGRGVEEIAWTFDPLVSRNAWFNLVKLGAHPTEYLTNFYGPMVDDLNGTDDTDRLLVRWRLRDPAAAAACVGQVSPADAAREAALGAVVVLDVDSGGRPVRAPARTRAEAPVALVRVPPDIEGLRGSDPAAARLWREEVREVLGELVQAGHRVEGFDRSGCYVVRRNP
ncbi:GNAT family N-acetyltransferase [Nocardioides oleivorans]|uniref:GNAT family N-acetyltransferase n=1 Tax=Nocardioides oleivorans TaxID=273676 RepID=UPI001F5E2943|nr:GNAT family N-acetyltransferase [Nocardioides oleivorans]